MSIAACPVPLFSALALADLHLCPRVEFVMDDNGDDEDYGFDYSDEEDADEENDVSLENEYYNAKGLLEDGARVDAAAGFLRVLQLERDLTGAGKGEWGFKALKQLIYLHVQERQLERALEYYQQLLTYVRSAVTRNYSERVIGELLDWLGANEHVPPGLLSQFYERTLATLVDEGTQRSERLWFKTEVRRGYLMLERGEYAGLSRLLKELHRFCRQAMRPTASKEAATAVPEETVVALDTDADVKIGSQLLELYALEMQLQMALTPGWTAATVSSQRARPGADSAGDAAVGGDYRGAAGALRDSASAHHGHHSRVRRQGAHGRGPVPRRVHRPVRGVQELRRGGRAPAPSLPQVLGVGEHAGQQRDQPVRLTRGTAVPQRARGGGHHPTGGGVPVAGSARFRGGAEAGSPHSGRRVYAAVRARVAESGARGVSPETDAAVSPRAHRVPGAVHGRARHGSGGGGGGTVGVADSGWAHSWHYRPVCRGAGIASNGVQCGQHADASQRCGRERRPRADGRDDGHRVAAGTRRQRQRRRAQHAAG
eukprot:ctg_77.g28